MRYRSAENELVPIIVIIILNFLVYLAIHIADWSGGNIIGYLALSRSIFFVYPWTIFTYMFTHEEFLHILFNMVTLYFFGTFFIRIAGINRFYITYLLGGLVAGLFILLIPSYNLIPFYALPDIPTIGASGAIFALGGVLTVLTPKIRVFIFPIPAPMPLWVAILGTFVILSFIPGVSWQGHLGGLLFGLLAGWYMRRRVRIIM